MGEVRLDFRSAHVHVFDETVVETTMLIIAIWDDCKEKEKTHYVTSRA
jgi:uncharacterized protein YabN with tetrapyrrole methylase and pyrophosphatase domain